MSKKITFGLWPTRWITMKEFKRLYPPIERKKAMEVIRIIRYAGYPSWVERTLETSLKEDLVSCFGSVQVETLPCVHNEAREFTSALKRMREKGRESKTNLENKD